MTTGIGAKNGIIESDEKTVQYLNDRGSTNASIFRGDDDAEYAKIFEYEPLN